MTPSSRVISAALIKHNNDINNNTTNDCILYKYQYYKNIYKQTKLTIK